MIREFHYEDFLPLASLAQKKRAARAKISLVIPTLNEEKTVGAIIEKARKELMEDVGLLDEIIVMDSASQDDTADVAARAGATVYLIGDVAPQYNGIHGKGAAIWKSQFVAKGDIIICVDADICNFQSHFIYGLAGPFLIDKDVIFAKSYYKRPLVLDDHSFENYGGRVTEILVRPLLSAFAPGLAAIRQPLSGEYAFRKEPMRAIPFSSGYGVEIGMIFDIYRKFGLSHFVQVDMGTRCHRNRPVDQLGTMALGIIQTMMRRFEQGGVLSLHTPCNDVMISQGTDGSKKTVVRESELPAFAEVQSSEGKNTRG
jgi:glucosyl-3-phosphoglycerate synthase